MEEVESGGQAVPPLSARRLVRLALVRLPLPAARAQVEEVQVRVEVTLHRPQITLQIDTIFL